MKINSGQRDGSEETHCVLTAVTAKQKIPTGCAVGLLSELLYWPETPGNSCLCVGENVLLQRYYHAAVRLVHAEVASISLLLFILQTKVHTTGPATLVMVSY